MYYNLAIESKSYTLELLIKKDFFLNLPLCFIVDVLRSEALPLANPSSFASEMVFQGLVPNIDRSLQAILHLRVCRLKEGGLPEARSSKA